MVGRADTLAQPSPATVTLDKETRLSGTTTDSHQNPSPQNDQGDRYGSIVIIVQHPNLKINRAASTDAPSPRTRTRTYPCRKACR